ncbi:hypothetical protein LMH73_024285 [Vibrio splendidus]|nr:hypothetical protein [Vibrio splendidus]MCC4880870.1 hypothetical protein [Vibrio splendidus]
MIDNQRTNPLGLPDTGIIESPIYRRYHSVFTKDGRSAEIMDVEDSSDGLIFTVRTQHESKTVVLAENDISYLPNNLSFEFFLSGLEIIKIADENGNWSTDERIKYVIENYDQETYSPDDYYDSVIICRHSGVYFEYDSKKATYSCSVGNNSICSDSLREAAKMPFEWAITECDLFESEKFASFILETLFQDGESKAIQLITEEPRLMKNGSLIIAELASKATHEGLTSCILKEAINNMASNNDEMFILDLHCKNKSFTDQGTESASVEIEFKYDEQDEDIHKCEVSVDLDANTLDIEMHADRNSLSEEEEYQVACFIKLKLLSGNN